MLRIRAVTLDAYGTVFDFESALPRIAGEVLAAQGRAGFPAGTLADSWGANFYALYEQFGGSRPEAGGEFRTIARLTADALELTSRQHGLGLDPWPGTEIWLRHLRAVRPFPEVPGVLAALDGRFLLAMLSDTDDGIIAPALERLGGRFRFVLTSEQVRAYKQDPRGTLFRRALAELGLPAEAVVHVGDSTADIRGAKAAGMRMAWVNRFGRELAAGCPRPDWEIPDLTALPELLDGD